jgi:methylated-DNA-protein-cysteine methyltransferase-like protein
VATYGQVAELAGLPGAARVVGAALRASPAELGLPWQRVVGKRSRTTARIAILDPIGGAVQRGLLEAEGVRFTASGAISLDQHGWLPADAPRPGRVRRAPPPASRRSRAGRR